LGVRIGPGSSAKDEFGTEEMKSVKSVAGCTLRDHKTAERK
jgi:hypothetical protein